MEGGSNARARPHDLVALSQFENMVAADVQKTVDAKFTSALNAEVNKIGQTRFVRFKNEVFTAAFVDHARALDAVKVELIKVSLKERNVPKIGFLR